LKYATWDSATG